MYISDRFCSILPRALGKAFSSWGAREDNGDEDDIREVLRRKTWRAKKCANDRDLARLHAMLSWSAEPLDHLSLIHI